MIREDARRRGLSDDIGGSSGITAANSKGLARLAGMWCNNPVFLAWLEDVSGRTFTPADAKEFVLLACGISSRSELDTNEHAERAFNVEVRRPFLAWRDAHPDEVAKH